MSRASRDPPHVRAAETILELAKDVGRAIASNNFPRFAEYAEVLADALESVGYADLADHLRALRRDPFRYVSPAAWAVIANNWRWQSIANSIVDAAAQVSSGLPPAIQNPNLSGQGYAPSHRQNPYHALLERFGYAYSHSTYVLDSLRGQTLRHTYRREDHCCIGVRGEMGDRPPPIWESTTSAFGRRGRRTIRGEGDGTLERYLIGRERRRRRR